MRVFGIGLLLVAAAAGAAEAQSRRRGGDDGQKARRATSARPEAGKNFPTKVSWTAVSLNGKAFSGERPTFILDEQFRIRVSAAATPLRRRPIRCGSRNSRSDRSRCRRRANSKRRSPIRRTTS